MFPVTVIVLSSWLISGVSGVSGGTYFFTSPSRILRGSTYDISVDILNGTDVTVEATLMNSVYNYTTRKYDVYPLKSASGVFNYGQTGSLSMPIEHDFECSSCRLNVRGSGGLQFERTLYTYVLTSDVVILVQTEKAIYKPGQRVRFRAFGVYPNLQLYNGTFDVIFYDPRGNKIKIYDDLSSPNNVIEGFLDLTDQPIFGTWKIGVTVKSMISTTQPFTVDDYDLPRYEVTVELSPYGLLSDTVLTGTVKAKYTFGQPVKGMVELHVGPNTGLNSCGDLPKTTQMGFEIDGEATFEMPITDVRRAIYIRSGTEVKVTAYVTESTTGVRLNGTSVIEYYSTEFTIQFLQNTPSEFKPGVPYRAYLQVTSPDGRPPIGGDRSVSVYTYGRYDYSIPNQSKYATYSFSGSFPLEPRFFTLPANGIIEFDVPIPKNCSYIYMRAWYGSSTYTKSASRMSSPSGNFIHLTLLGKFIQADSTVGVQIDSTEPLYNVSYMVTSRGVVVDTRTVHCDGQDPCIFDLAVTTAMSPTAHLIVYYVRGPQEIVGDGIAFNVEGIFENKVGISFSRNESEPHQNITVNLKALTGSDMYILVTDMSVLLLKSGNDITPEKVQESVTKFDNGARPDSDEFPLAISSRSFSYLFSSLGLNVLTDLSFSSPSPPQSPGYPSTPSYYGSPATPGSPSYPGSPSAPGSPSSPGTPTGGQPSLKEVERIRKFFPEGWLWQSTRITSEDGNAQIETVVPDTITSWVASAFATHPTRGLGVSPTTAKLRVFRPFFVSLKYPDKAVRGEQAVIQATVFNYLPDDADVTVTLKCSSSFYSINITVDEFNEKTEKRVSGDQVQVIHVRADKQGVVYFPIELVAIGVVKIEVTAQTYVAADGVQRQIIVRPEGAPVTFNVPFFIELDANSTNSRFADNISLSLPPSAVEDSEQVLVKVTGDLIGSSLSNIEYLTPLPTGCGEQSLVKTAPNLYIGQYLRATGQLSGSLADRIISNLNYGYQRQLWYQRYDYGFSAFGSSDESGSTWLTAFVARIFTKAMEFTYIDSAMPYRAVGWLVSRQNQDGSFNELGRVINRQIQGTGTGPALTAHVLLTMLASDPLAPRQACVESNLNCYTVYRWGNVTSKAVQNLESLVNSNAIHDPFSMSIVSYALALAGSSKANVLFDRLGQHARAQGSFVYWTNAGPLTQGGHSQYYNFWNPPRIQASSIDIVTTGYALLTLTAQGRIQEGLPVVRWLTSQKNAFGGFSSTQDTMVALQALSAYATRAYGTPLDMNIEVTGDESTISFDLNRENALSLQIQEIKNAGDELMVDATGTGVAIVEIEHSFYVTDELTTPSFDVAAVILDGDFESFTLMVCSKWLWNRETGMVVQEIGIPSGFTPDMSTLDDVAGLRRAERKGDIVAVYFDGMGKASICYSILMTRDERIARSESSYIKTYDYYEPSDQATTPYLPRALRDATVCDVCEGCCPDRQATPTETPTTITSTRTSIRPDSTISYVTPISPGVPSNPSTPNTPAPPGTPSSPESPSFPESPSSPESSLYPESSFYPESPSTPESPSFPESPSSPESPIFPGSTSYTESYYPRSSFYPESPSTPKSPSTSESPSTPKSPSTSKGPSTPRSTSYPESSNPRNTIYPESPIVPETPSTPVSPSFTESPFLPGSPDYPQTPGTTPSLENDVVSPTSGPDYPQTPPGTSPSLENDYYYAGETPSSTGSTQAPTFGGDFQNT